MELSLDTTALVLRASTRWKDGDGESMTIAVGNESVPGYAMLTSEPVVVEDVRTDKRFRTRQWLNDNGVISTVAVIIHNENQPFGVLIAASYVRRTFSDNDVHFLQATAHVISRAFQRRSLERQLLLKRDEAERLSELDRLRKEFISTISHDLRTPLTSIRAGLGMIDISIVDRLRPEEQGLLGNVRRNIDRLGLLIDDLVTLNQLEAGALQLDHEPLDLRTVVADTMSAVHALIRAKQQQLESDLPEPLPVEGDARRLEQVLVNVLANANRHTPGGTRIQVSGEVVDGEVQLAVRDTGPGIPPDELEAIFQRFHRLPSGDNASGLGLAIARSLVELQGGYLWAESEPGEGSVFKIKLPHSPANHTWS